MVEIILYLVAAADKIVGCRGNTKDLMPNQHFLRAVFSIKTHRRQKILWPGLAGKRGFVMEQGSWGNVERALIILYWLFIYMLTVSFADIFAPLVTSDMSLDYVLIWYPVFVYLKAEGNLSMVAWFCSIMGFLDIAIISRYFDEYNHIWLGLRTVLLLAVLFPYFCVALFYFNGAVDTYLQENLVESTTHH